MTAKSIYEIGEIPPLGDIPEQMYAQVIRAERFGEPKRAFQIESVAVPRDLKPDEALVLVMAAGVNYNNVWAARGLPVDVIRSHQRDGDPSDFHIGGSDASGIVYALGRKGGKLKIGDRVVIHCGMWNADCPRVRAGDDPMFSPSFRIWGYEASWGSFAQFTKVQTHQCLPKAEHLTWEQAAAPTLVGATAYRMLMAWPPHTVRPNDVVLIWGGAGGLGCQAIQIAKVKGGIPVAVISDDSKIDFCTRLGAKGCINRKRFTHWGMPPHWTDTEAYGRWVKEAKAFGQALWDVIGERRNPRIVFEHPGEATIPTSIFACDTGGMVAICAGTTGFNAVADLRYLWMRQKRLQGSHFANDDQATAYNDLVRERKIDPCLARTFSFAGIRDAHQLMFENRHPHGNMAGLVGAPREGMRDL